MNPAPIAAIAGALELLLLLGCRRRVRGTTLTAAWWWAVAAALVVAATEVAIAGAAPSPRTGGEALRFAAGALTFCPLMAALGAKRPQHQAWQFVVLAFWGIVALPALENYILRRGQALEVGGLRSAFLAGLIAVGVLNWLPTRFWLTAVLVGVGQIVWFAPHVPAMIELTHPLRVILATVFFLGGTLAANTVDLLPARRPTTELDRVWRDFRDGFGALWALRVAERVNAAATIGRWPFRLGWSGFQSTVGGALDPGTLAPEVRQSVQTTLDNLLRRFVKPEWIAKRRETNVH